MKQQILSLAVAGVVASTAVAETALEEITIIGTREAARTLPGSAALVDNEQIRIEAANDINQLLKTVPGIYIMEEDGYGLRPNIGIRGATSERSSKVTLMEDGVMIAPAPYSNPAAYYFPTMARMDAVEVLKGAPLLRYGPQTTGGVINMVSTQIPESNRGRLNFRYGQNGEADLLANYGGRAGDFGFLLETTQRRSDGYKDIDRSSRDSGYEISDYLLKLGWEGERQSLLFKAQHSEETSNETYLGLTDTDFDRDPDRRYGLSSIDQMDNDHQGYNLTYSLVLGDNVKMSLLGYYNKYARDWLKLDDDNFIDDANAGDSVAQGILDGTRDALGLEYKHNNREYVSQGLDLNFDIDLGAHQVAAGVRQHEDEMDRYQPVDIYNQVDGELAFVESVAPTGGNNRFEEADATSLWLVDNWQVSETLDVNLALRYENVDSSRKQYASPDRSDSPRQRSNSSDAWLPGASFTYQLADNWQLLAGVHRGFSPLGGGATENQEPEVSVNWEVGFRYQGDWFVEAIGFYSDFENSTENCSNASPCSNGAKSGSFVTGQAIVQGLEFQLGTELEAGNLRVPLDLMYTYTQAEISKDNPTEGFEDGDQLASVPENTFSLRVGLETAMGWNNYVVAKYIDEMCVSVGCNNGDDRFGRTRDLFVIDLISRYELTPESAVYLKVENVFDDQSIVSRQPDGARPNKPQTASVGVEWRF
ncbi:TonB-dependent receptor family protein [Haliea salexigens]|uniref:TonB-dependent receptor family protein n=1 Tax=Haliea salexigens TaxID=287487 RepID=UPI000403C6A7|nr:TonB-dependent receptor [Haliea salexigens]|tara:strand:- start:1482 stop:3596 length:2115 start_codon:yes stop_codon:yes gene_type:complete